MMEVEKEGQMLQYYDHHDHHDRHDHDDHDDHDFFYGGSPRLRGK